MLKSSYEGHCYVIFPILYYFIFLPGLVLQMYLQIRMTWEGSKLLKHLLQFLAVMAAWATALTRVSDYMHHWGDVLSGIVIGTLFGIFTVSPGTITQLES